MTETCVVGALEDADKASLHAVVDTFGPDASGVLHRSKQPEAAVAVAQNGVLSQSRTLTLPVTAVLTENGREVCGTEGHPSEPYLDDKVIEHRRTKVRGPKTKGFVERVNGTVLDELLQARTREKFRDTLEALRADLDAWLDFQNSGRPHLGSRQMGRRPIATVTSFGSRGA